MASNPVAKEVSSQAHKILSRATRKLNAEETCTVLEAIILGDLAAANISGDYTAIFLKILREGAYHALVNLKALQYEGAVLRGEIGVAAIVDPVEGEEHTMPDSRGVVQERIEGYARAKKEHGADDRQSRAARKAMTAILRSKLKPIVISASHA